ncbi:hypothetical protein LIER_37917 [Lithospermum erythrorhizon]|uniref:Uncharacterized protein n=1 Tax=Lithospermum erythrorhizon TaxID=34254 RepID=A0AAV3PUH2_LITER
MLDTCFDGKPTSENSWLCFIYGFRKQWSSVKDVVTKDQFTAGKTTTQLSEELNAFARHYRDSSMDVLELMRQFHSMVVDLRFNEKSRDYYMQ